MIFVVLVYCLVVAFNLASQRLYKEVDFSDLIQKDENTIIFIVIKASSRHSHPIVTIVPGRASALAYLVQFISSKIRGFNLPAHVQYRYVRSLTILVSHK